MANISRMAGGLGNFLLSLMLVWISEMGGGRAPSTLPVPTETVQMWSAASTFHARASVEHVGKEKVWTLRLEVRGRDSRAAHEAE